MEEQINKTIVVSYDDITRMKDFCTNNGEGVTKDFMDWYVNENSFFSKTGMLICENVINGSAKKFVVSFDFNNPDIPSFVMYDYVKQKPVCRYIMYREDNLAMKDVTIKISWIDLKFFMQPDSVFLSTETFENVKKNYGDAEMNDKMKGKLNKIKQDYSAKKKNLNLYKKQLNLIEKKLEEVNYDIAKFMAQQGVYFTYATMYYFAKNKAKEVVGIAKTDMIGEGKQVTALYKYTGYVNINEVKVYKPVIKKDGPAREYGRHIEKWSVRGHYRKVNGKTIWIEPFEKGEGELEKRIYGTEKESEVNLIPKVFEVVRSRQNPPEYPTPVKIHEFITELPTDQQVHDRLVKKLKPSKPAKKLVVGGSIPKRDKISVWKKIFSFLNKFKFKKR